MWSGEPVATGMPADGVDANGSGSTLLLLLVHVDRLYTALVVVQLCTVAHMM